MTWDWVAMFFFFNLSYGTDFGAEDPRLKHVETLLGLVEVLLLKEHGFGVPQRATLDGCV